MRRLREIPPDDGLVPAVLDGRQVFVDPEILRPTFEAKMAIHDAASVWDRWGHNQWGIGWLTAGLPVWRSQIEAAAPRVKTDLNQYEYYQCVMEYQNEGNDMAISMREREKLPKRDFALPGKGKGKEGKGSGSYPIDTPGRARAALSRGAANASPKEDAEIKRKVERKYPEMKVAGKKGEKEKRR